MSAGAPIQSPPDDPRAVAAAWFARRRSGAMSEQDLRDLDVWLQRDPAHRAAFELAERTWKITEAVRDNPTMLAMRERALRRGTRAGAYAIGGLAACVAIGAAGLWTAERNGWIALHRPQTPAQEFRTEIGQRAAITLADGSRVTLDTDTVVRTRVDDRGRRVELEKGRAFFRVAPDRSRPFVVAAGGTDVIAVGTAFAVRRDAGRFEVALAEGHVRVEAPKPGADPNSKRRVEVADMRPGFRLTKLAGRNWTLEPVDMDDETRWLTGKLVFKARALGEVAAEMNRYSEKKIVVDPAIATTPISGGFVAGDVDEFVAAVAAYEFARVRMSDDAVVELAPRKKNATP